MFAWLENTPVALWVGLSLWAYPLLLAVHIVGLAVVVGIFSMRDLRLLGCFPGLAPAAFLPLSRLAWVGFNLAWKFYNTDTEVKRFMDIYKRMYNKYKDYDFSTAPAHKCIDVYNKVLGYG